MTGELIIFPVRIGVRVTRFALRTGLRATGQAAAVATDLVKSVTGGATATGDRPAPPASEPERRAPEPERRAPEPERRASEAERRAPEAPAPPSEAPVINVDDVIDLDAATEPEPAHVSEEPELVEEVADPGAEDGAGAEVTVAEPWEGYRQMNAGDVIDRISVATPAELAAVQLYENAGRRRETVLAAAQRQLRAAHNTK